MLAWILDDPEREASASELSRTLDIPQPTVHRDVAQGLSAGILRARNVGRTKLVSANTESPYFAPLRELMVRSFGIPDQLARRLAELDGVDAAYLYGSWAARFVGESGTRPVGDIDLLVLGDPDVDQLYAITAELSPVIGYPIEVTVRPSGWIETGTGSFHDTVTSRAMVEVLVQKPRSNNLAAASTASTAQP